MAKDQYIRVQDVRTKQFRMINKKSYELGKRHYRLVAAGEDERSEEDKIKEILAENARLKAQIAANNAAKNEDSSEEETEGSGEQATEKKRPGRKSNAQKAAEAAAEQATNENE